MCFCRRTRRCCHDRRVPVAAAIRSASDRVPRAMTRRMVSWIHWATKGRLLPTAKVTPGLAYVTKVQSHRVGRCGFLANPRRVANCDAVTRSVDNSMPARSSNLNQAAPAVSAVS